MSVSATSEYEHLVRFMQGKRASGLSPATIRWYEFNLRQYWRWLCDNHVGVVTGKDVVAFFAFLCARGYSVVTLRDKYVVLSAYLASTGRRGLLAGVGKPRPRGHVRCFTVDEVSAVLSCIDYRRGFLELRDYAIVCPLLGTGVRRGELLSLPSLPAGDFFLVRGKGRKLRSVPISPALRRILAYYEREKEKRFPLSGRLFVNRFGEPLTEGGLRAIFTRLRERSGVCGERFSPHSFRHFFATSFLRNGGSLPALQRILGHEHLSTTGIYLRWDDSMAKDENDRACPLDNLLF